MLVDTHCHIYKEYYEDIDDIIKKSYNNNVKYLINNACNLQTSLEVLELSNKYNDMYCVIGVHPNENLNDLKDISLLLKNNLNNKKLIGVGEIGLDYYYTKDNREEQINIFESQLKLAEEYNLPVIIHSRNATEDMLTILKKYRLKGIIHCFNGSIEVAKEYIKLGYKLGINGVITFKNCKLIDIIKAIGIENIVFETDSPYLTPEPYRGAKNDPSYVFNIVEFLAEKLEIDNETLAKVSNKNVCELFDIKLNS